MSRLKMKLKKDPIGSMLKTGYMRFDSSIGVHGLAKVSGTRIDILAVVATKPGKGQFRRFIAAAKNAYQTVVVWEDWNPVVTAALQRYGFQRVSELDDEGKRNSGLMFTRPTQ